MSQRADVHPFHLVLLTLCAALSKSQNPQKLASIESLPNEWERLSFTYQNQPAALIRIPKPEQPDPAVLEVSPGFYLSAYLLVCPQQGCEVQTHRGNPQKLVCRCHGSVFWAKDGVYFAGPESPNLQRIALEVEASTIFATGLKPLTGRKGFSTLIKPAFAPS